MSSGEATGGRAVYPTAYKKPVKLQNPIQLSLTAVVPPIG